MEPASFLLPLSPPAQPTTRSVNLDEEKKRREELETVEIQSKILPVLLLFMDGAVQI